MFPASETPEKIPWQIEYKLRCMLYQAWHSLKVLACHSNSVAYCLLWKSFIRHSLIRFQLVACSWQCTSHQCPKFSFRILFFIFFSVLVVQQTIICAVSICSKRIWHSTCKQWNRWMWLKIPNIVGKKRRYWIGGKIFRMRSKK